jgi:hypothetical protein
LIFSQNFSSFSIFIIFILLLQVTSTHFLRSFSHFPQDTITKMLLIPMQQFQFVVLLTFFKLLCLENSENFQLIFTFSPANGDSCLQHNAFPSLKKGASSNNLSDLIIISPCVLSLRGLVEALMSRGRQISCAIIAVARNPLVHDAKREPVVCYYFVNLF